MKTSNTHMKKFDSFNIVMLDFLVLQVQASCYELLHSHICCRATEYLEWSSAGQPRNTAN